MKKVAQYVYHTYLPVTETWIYSQIANICRHRQVIYANHVQNLDQFPLRERKLRVLDPGNKWAPAALSNYALRKLLNIHPGLLFSLLDDRPALIHAHFGPGGYYCARLKKILRIPLVTMFYGYDLNMLPTQYPAWKKRYRYLFKNGDRFLVEGHHARQCLINLGCPEDKIVVYRLGIDIDAIHCQPRRPGAGGEVKVLVSASFREKKGIPFAVKAFGIVKRRHPELDLRLTIIGDSRGIPEEEGIKKEILDAIDEYGIAGCTTIKGYQPHSVFTEELYAHHIFLQPSVRASNGDTEGGAPVSIIEASASGMPVLATAHCDIPEVVPDGRSGFLVPERDTMALADKLEHLALNPGLWEGMGLAGREHVERNYNLKVQVRKLEEIYDDLLTSS
jgi:colanic acid/amylovoran biosynthesis glycosyltransferase